MVVMPLHIIYRTLEPPRVYLNRYLCYGSLRHWSLLCSFLLRDYSFTNAWEVAFALHCMTQHAVHSQSVDLCTLSVTTKGQFTPDCSVYSFGCDQNHFWTLHFLGVESDLSICMSGCTAKRILTGSEAVPGSMEMSQGVSWQVLDLPCTTHENFSV